MLEIISQNLLKYFIKNNVDEKFTIYDFKDLIKDFGLNKEQILENVKSLELKGFIIIKYLDKEKICLSVLPFARQSLQNQEDNLEYLLALKNENFKFIVLIFVFAFIGSLIGSLIGRLF